MYIYDPTNFKLQIMNFMFGTFMALTFAVSLFTPELPMRKGFLFISGLMFCFFFVFYLSTK